MRLVREAPLRSTEVVVVLRPGSGPRTTTTPVEPSRGSRTPAIPTTTPVEPVLTSERARREMASSSASRTATSTPCPGSPPTTTPWSWSTSTQRRSTHEWPPDLGPGATRGWVLVEQVRVQRGRQVPLAPRRDDDDDRLALVGRIPRQLGGRPQGSAGGDSDEQTLFLGRTPCPDQRIVGGDLDDPVDQRRVEDLRDEPRADALDLVRALRLAGQDGRLGRLDGDDLYVRLALLEHLTDASDRAARADTGDEEVDLTLCIGPDLLGRRLLVDRHVRRVRELASQNGTRRVRHDLLGAGVGARDAFGSRGEDQLGTERPQQRATLLREALREHDDRLVATSCGDPGERDAGVAGRALDDGAARLQGAVRLRGVDDRDADAVLHARSRVEVLELRQNDRLRVPIQAIDLDERGAADQLGRVLVVSHGVDVLPQRCDFLVVLRLQAAVSVSTSWSAPSRSGFRGAPTMRWRMTPRLSSSTTVGVRVTLSCSTRSRRVSSSTSIWATAGASLTTSVSSRLAVRHGAHTTDENCTNVAEEPNSWPSCSAPSRTSASRRRAPRIRPSVSAR